MRCGGGTAEAASTIGAHTQQTDTHQFDFVESGRAKDAVLGIFRGLIIKYSRSGFIISWTVSFRGGRYREFLSVASSVPWYSSCGSSRGLAAGGLLIIYLSGIYSVRWAVDYGLSNEWCRVQSVCVPVSEWVPFNCSSKCCEHCHLIITADVWWLQQM